MRGEVLSYDHAAGNGLISGDDGVRYSFGRNDLFRPTPPSRGDQVDFVPEGDVATQLVVMEPAASLEHAGLAPAPPSLSPWGYFVRCSTTAYFQGDGRASVGEYWSFQLIHWALMLVFIIVALVGGAALSPTDGDVAQVQQSNAVIGLALLIAGLAYIYFIIPTITALARRLHDMGQSAFWILVGIVPFGGFALFVMSLMPSQPGPNAYGLPPR